jgi:hypothetical protein
VSGGQLHPIEFVKQVEAFVSRYEGFADNQLKKSALRDERKAAIKAALPSLKVRDWAGEIRSMQTDSQGDAYLGIRLEGSNSIVLKVQRVKKGTEVYKKLSELKNGDKILFSGTFLRGDLDYLKETSWTERGAMTQPDFTFELEDASAAQR